MQSDQREKEMRNQANKSGKICESLKYREQ